MAREILQFWRTSGLLVIRKQVFPGHRSHAAGPGIEVRETTRRRPEDDLNDAASLE